MALVDTTWYCNSVAYAAVPAFAISTAYTAGQRVRQLTTPAVGSERVFIVIVAGTSAGTEPTWVLTRGAKTISNTVTFMECTGQAALNGDFTNTQTWAAVKAATPAVLGQIIKRSSGASYQICTTAGAMSASEPAFSDTAGVTTTDTTAVWTSLGAVGSYSSTRTTFARINSACAAGWLVAGGTLFVGNNHAESQTTLLNIIPQGSLTTVTKILCHNSAGSYPPTSADLTTGATLSTTANAAVSISQGAAGHFYFYGLAFKVGVGATGTNSNINVNAARSWVQFDACSFELVNPSASVGIYINSAGEVGGIIFDKDTRVKFSHVSQTIFAMTTYFLWQSGSVLVSGSLIPTTFMKFFYYEFPSVTLEALDLSALTGAIVAPYDSTASGQCFIRDCKLHASATIPTPTSGMALVQLARSSA